MPVLVPIAEEKRKVYSWVPVSLWEKVEKLGYDSPTRAVCDRLELLFNGNIMATIKHTLGTFGHITDTSGHTPDTEMYKLKLEIQRLNEGLHVAPDPVKMAQLCTRSEELQNHIETLKQEII